MNNFIQDNDSKLIQELTADNKKIAQECLALHNEIKRLKLFTEINCLHYKILDLESKRIDSENEKLRKNFDIVERKNEALMFSRNQCMAGKESLQKQVLACETASTNQNKQIDGMLAALHERKKIIVVTMDLGNGDKLETTLENGEAVDMVVRAPPGLGRGSPVTIMGPRLLTEVETLLVGQHEAARLRFGCK